MKKWDDRFIALAQHVAEWSKDPSTKVGAVIVDPQRRIIGMGYNGFPRGVGDHEHRYAIRDLKYEMVVHAEANALMNSVKEVAGCTLYCTFCTCPRCAALIIQSGIKRVIYAKNEEAEKRWAEPLKISFMMFDEAGVEHGYAE